MPTNLGRARAEELQVTGKAKASQVEGAHVLIGKESHLRNTVNLKSFGSLLSFDFEYQYDITNLQTGSGTGNFTVEVTGPKLPTGILVGDTIRIQNLADGYTFSGITKAQLEGPHLVTAVGGAGNVDVSFVISGLSATQSATDSNFAAKLDLHVYQLLNLADANLAFSRTSRDYVGTLEAWEATLTDGHNNV